MVDSSDLALVLSEADDIAQSVSQKPTSAHVVLALFTVDNPGHRLLKERGVDEDSLLALLKAAPIEPDGTLPRAPGAGPGHRPALRLGARRTACTSSLPSPACAAPATSCSPEPGSTSPRCATPPSPTS